MDGVELLVPEERELCSVDSSFNKTKEYRDFI